MGKKSVKFSIITVCYNAEKVIRLTMESVLNQKWSNFEYIIVDGASTDATVDIIREYAEKDSRIQWSSEADRGIYNAMNKGIRYTKGDFLVFLNAGDTFHSVDVLEKAVEVTAGADIIIGNVAFKTETGLSECKYSVGRKLLENLESGNNVCHQVIFAAKECLKNGFDEHFMICADYDWLCRQVNERKKIVKLEAIVVDYDICGVTQQVRYQKIHWDEYFEVIGKHFPQPDFKYGKEVKQLFIQERKERFLCKFLNRWLFLKQRGISLSTFFAQQKIKSVAIYGIHYVGERLYDELKESETEVKYAIDRNIRECKWGILVFHPDDELESVDAVIVTPIFDFLEIKAGLSVKLDCPIFSIEDVLFYDYECGRKPCG